jgi:uncharacterized protein (DUF427 family)
MNSPPTGQDYPPPAAARGRVEPCPRRIRGYAGTDLVFDTLGARYVWEIPYYPHYYIPVDDVRTEFLTDASAARIVEDDGAGIAAGYVRFEWDSLDWFEEDEQIFEHPRNPYARLDALRSHRHVRVELDGVVLAETHSPVLLFETGLPTRYYIDRTDVSMQHLVSSETQSVCPYKGVTSAYWSVRVGTAVHSDLAWMYQYPLGAVSQIAGLIAFYNEKVDIVLDGVRLPRPVTHMS